MPRTDRDDGTAVVTRTKTEKKVEHPKRPEEYGYVHELVTVTNQVGETVMVGMLEGDVACNDSHATQVSRTRWARHGGLGPKVNHSCSPNCGVELNATGACDFVAREPIARGEEITFD